MNIEVDKCYMHRGGDRVSVRKVLRIEHGRVFYKRIYGPALNPETGYRNAHNTYNCKLRKFRQWAKKEIDENDDFAKYEGFIPSVTFIMHTTDGRPLLRMNQKSVQRFIRKGYAVEVDGEYHLTSDVLEHQLSHMNNSPYLLTVKDRRCVVCGKEGQLSCHHVVAKRHVKKIPLEIREKLCNTLYLCFGCHLRYEKIPEPDVVDNPIIWQEHFLEHMEPKYLPDGWQIWSGGNTREEYERFICSPVV